MPYKILVVDDEPDFIKALSIRLRDAGYEPLGSTGGKDAIDRAHQIMPEVILLDIMMPGMDGLQTKAKLNEDQATASIPVIFLSADSETDIKLKGLGLGADDYITKPFDHKELIGRIRSVLDKKHYYEQLSMTDGLTGLYNYAFFKRQLSSFFNIAKRYKKTFSLILADVDGLKEINDRHGHTAGDSVLKEFSSVAGQVLRESDVIARYGGDEFAMLLPETPIGPAAVALERIRCRIREREIALDHSDEKIKFSISAGIAEYEASCVDETDLFNRADKKLYEDKASK